MNSLSKSILNTICYYDILDYPLTSFEIWKNLIGDRYHAQSETLSLNLIVLELEDEELKRYLDEYRGFYFLKGRKDLIEKRIFNNKISVSKIKKLRRVVWFLRFIPFVRAVMVTGRLAMKNAENSSDWDLLVVLKSGRIWTGRTLVTGAVHSLGKRRHGNKIKNRVCLNYFITDKSLEIKYKDLFSANEYLFCFPLFDSKNYYNKFQLKNSWIREYKPNYYLVENNNLKSLVETKISKIIRNLGEKMISWDYLEERLQIWQRDKIARNPKTHQKGSIVEASNEALIFLPSPQGPGISNKFLEKTEKINKIYL